MSNKRIALYTILFTIIIFCLIFFIINEANLDYDEKISSKSETINLAVYYSKIDEQNEYLEKIIEKYDNVENNEPYMLDGFTYVEGSVDEGFVIEDETGNQFVWVPCNSENLKKIDFSNDNFLSSENCWEEEYKEFLESSLQNGGFYVSRFETGIEDEKIVSKSNAEVLTNVTREEIVSAINDTFENENYNIELINGYAYDRMISWIIEDSNVENVSFEIYENEPVFAGRNSYKNIYDIFDNMFELTLENYLNTLIYRGYSDLSVIDMVDSKTSNRWNASEDYTYATINITGRLVLYKSVEN